MNHAEGEVMAGIDPALAEGSKAALLDLDPNISLEYLEKASALSGKPAPVHISRERLVLVHNTELKKLGKDSKGPRPVKKISLSLAYPPSTKPLLDLEKLYLRDLLVEMHHEDKVLVLRTITELYPGAGIVAIVEDETGDADKLTIYNQNEASALSALPEGSVVAIKEPYYQFNGDGDFMICVDHPSDIMLLDDGHPLVPKCFYKADEEHGEATPTAWVRKGDESFMGGKFPDAVRCYSRALGLMVKGDEAAMANMLGKRARVRLSLRCYDDAIADALASRNATKNDWKAYLVAAKACYQLQRYDDSLKHLDSALEKSSSEAILKKERDRCQARVRESREGDFDLRALSAAVNRRNIHLDAASFVRKTEVRDSAIHGRGLFATCDIAVGELIFCEKAVCLPNEYNVKHNGAALYVKLVEACSTNPSLHQEILQLHSGSYSPSSSRNNSRSLDVVDGAPVVDVFLLEAIRRANCFMGPHNSSTAASPAWSLERDGMARGMWLRAARANHACWPNSARSFLGDLLLSVATEPVRAGDEITHVYLPPRALPESRARQFVASWGFACGCRLCAAEIQSSAQQHVRRRDVLQEISGVIRKQEEKENIRKRGSNNTNAKNTTLAPPHSVLRTVEKLTRKLEDLHEEQVYGTLPRLALVWPTMWLLGAYRGMQNHAKTLKWAAQALRNFGFLQPAGTGEQDWAIFGREPVGITTFEAAKALRHARDANLTLGRAEAARQCDDASKLAWRILVGFEPEEEVHMSDWIGDEYKGV
ncbi:SET domain-containing protein [Apiospora sp. TS-2023a]